MSKTEGLSRRQLLGSGLVATASGLLVSRETLAQRRGVGSVIFTSGRPGRDTEGDPRPWANAHHVQRYDEDTTNHLWRVYFFAFFNRLPESNTINLRWLRLAERNQRQYISADEISLDRPNRIMFHQATLLHNEQFFQPNERYEAELAVVVGDSARVLARGQVELVGPVVRQGNTVDFTGQGGPQIH